MINKKILSECKALRQDFFFSFFLRPLCVLRRTASGGRIIAACLVSPALRGVNGTSLGNDPSAGAFVLLFISAPCGRAFLLLSGADGGGACGPYSSLRASRRSLNSSLNGRCRILRTAASDGICRGRRISPRRGRYPLRRHNASASCPRADGAALPILLILPCLNILWGLR